MKQRRNGVCDRLQAGLRVPVDTLVLFAANVEPNSPDDRALWDYLLVSNKMEATLRRVAEAAGPGRMAGRIARFQLNRLQPVA